MTTPSTPIWSVQRLRVDSDGRDYYDFEDEDVFYANKEEAQAEADRLNAKAQERYDHDHERALARYHTLLAAYKAKEASGLHSHRLFEPRAPQHHISKDYDIAQHRVVGQFEL